MLDPNATINGALRQRIIETADEYHIVAEEQWGEAIDLAPESEEAEFEFRRLIRAALMLYSRAYLVLAMIETDDEQQLEELLDIVAEHEPELEEFFKKNDVYDILDEDATNNLSQVFATAEATRAMLLQYSTNLAALLGERF